MSNEVTRRYVDGFTAFYYSRELQEERLTSSSLPAKTPSQATTSGSEQNSDGKARLGSDQEFGTMPFCLGIHLL
jgi:hypothetical protein